MGVKWKYILFGLIMPCCWGMQCKDTEVEAGTYKVVVEQWVPYVRINTLKSASIQISGPMFSLLTTVAEKLNLTYAFCKGPDGSWGNVYGNGSFNGMIGALQRNEADFLIGPSAISYDRQNAIDVGIPFMVYSQKLLLTRPESSGIGFGLFNPFSITVWLCGAVSAILLTLFVFQLIQCGDQFKGLSKNKNAYFSAMHITLFPNEATQWKPITLISRVTLGLWIMVCLVLAKSYEGSLISQLTVGNSPILINSIEELLNQDQKKWRYESFSYVSEFLEATEIQLFKKFKERSNGTMVDCYHSRFQIFNGNFAALCDAGAIRKAIGEYYSIYGECNLYASRQSYITVFYSWGFRKNFPYTKDINTWLQRIFEMGFIGKWLDEEISNATACERTSNDSQKREIKVLSLVNMKGIFFVLLSGYAVSIVLFCMEYISGSVRLRRRGSL